MVPRTKKDMQDMNLRQDTILDRNVLKNVLVNFKNFQEKINVKNLNGGKPLGKGYFYTGEMKSQISK